MKVTVEESLYSIAEENMVKAGLEMPFSREAYSVVCCSSDWTVFDVRTAQSKGCMIFTEVAFLQALIRVFDEKTKRAIIKTGLVGGEDVIKAAQLRSIQLSAEFILRGTRIRNNVYSSAKKGIPPGQATYGAAIPQIVIAIYERAARIYIKLPVPIRKVIKKMIGAS